MEKGKENSIDTFHWIEKIIKSCENEEQLGIAEHLIELFNKKYEDDLVYDKLIHILKQKKLDYEI